jgi:hypothetical protein
LTVRADETLCGVVGHSSYTLNDLIIARVSGGLNDMGSSKWDHLKIKKGKTKKGTQKRISDEVSNGP